MIKLYGIRMSNYYSLTKALLIEKNIDFEEVKAPPSQDEDYLQRSPMGKMPAIEVDGRYLSESVAIATYLEQIAPEPKLIPDDPFEAAKVMELVYHLKLDVELVARRCLPQLLFNKPVSEETKESTRADLHKGIKAVNRLFVGEPYAAGGSMTLADFYTCYCLPLASMITKAVLEEDLLADQPKMQAVLAKMAEHPSVQRVAQEQQGK